jgi:hypothetical protein
LGREISNLVKARQQPIGTRGSWRRGRLHGRGFLSCRGRD